MDRTAQLNRLVVLLAEANEIANKLGLDFQTELSDIQDHVAYELLEPEID
jgi:hypothetical protein